MSYFTNNINNANNKKLMEKMKINIIYRYTYEQIYRNIKHMI